MSTNPHIFVAVPFLVPINSAPPETIDQLLQMLVKQLRLAEATAENDLATHSSNWVTQVRKLEEVIALSIDKWRSVENLADESVIQILQDYLQLSTECAVLGMRAISHIRRIRPYCWEI